MYSLPLYSIRMSLIFFGEGGHSLILQKKQEYSKKKKGSLISGFTTILHAQNYYTPFCQKKKKLVHPCTGKSRSLFFFFKM